MRVFIRLIILGFILLPTTGYAEADADSACQDAQVQLEDRFGNLDRFQSLLRIDDAVAQAFQSMLCQPQYADCRFGFCEEGEQKKPQHVIDTTHTPDPLAWLRQPMSCEFLLDQIKSRYGPLGRFSDLPQFKKDEIKVVLDTSCSKRFAHCNFRACQDGTSSATQVDSQEVSVTDARSDIDTSQEILQRKRVALQSLYHLWRERRAKEIERVVAEEQQKGLAWGPFRVGTVEE